MQAIGGVMPNQIHSGGRPRKRPAIYDLAIGESVVFHERMERINDCIQYIRRSRGWRMKLRQLDFGIEVTRYA